MDRTAVIDAMAEALCDYDFPTDQATAALDAALAAGCVLPDMLEQVGWRPKNGTKLYVVRPTKFVDDDGAMWDVDCEWVPVFIIRGANDA